MHINLFNQAPDWWDSKVQKHNGVFYSTTYWIKFLETLKIGNGKYLELVDKDETIFLILVFETLLGGTVLLWLPKWFLQLLNKISFLKSLSFHLQPVLIKNISEEALMKYLEFTTKYILDLAKKQNKSIVAADLIGFKNIESAEKLQKQFCTNTDITATCRLNLNKSTEQLFASLAGEERNMIRKAQKMEAVVKELTPMEIKTFYKELKHSWELNGLAVNSFKFYKTLAEQFPDNAKFFVVLKDNQVLAGSGLVIFSKTIVEFSMYVSPKARQYKIPAGDLLKWHLIEYGVNIKAQYLDFNMISVCKHSTDTKTKNINSFKLKWHDEILYGIKINSVKPFQKSIKLYKDKIFGK